MPLTCECKQVGEVKSGRESWAMGFHLLLGLSQLRHPHSDGKVRYGDVWYGISGLAGDKPQVWTGTVLWVPGLPAQIAAAGGNWHLCRPPSNGPEHKWSKASCVKICQTVSAPDENPRQMEGDFMQYLVLSLLCPQWVISLPFFMNWPAAGACCCLMFNEMCPSGDS